MDPIIIYGLETGVVRGRDKRRLIAVQNTTERMILSLFSRNRLIAVSLRSQMAGVVEKAEARERKSYNNNMNRI